MIDNCLIQLAIKDVTEDIPCLAWDKYSRACTESIFLMHLGFFYTSFPFYEKKKNIMY